MINEKFEICICVYRCELFSNEKRAALNFPNDVAQIFIEKTNRRIKNYPNYLKKDYHTNNLFFWLYTVLNSTLFSSMM